MPDPVIRLNAALEGRYAIERELGEGGMATVYLADDLKHERKVALKVLKPELAAVVGAERFLAEIKTTANLQHPHILPLFDSGEADGFLFYVMPYVEGETLQDRIDREKQLPVDEALRIATAVANALHSAHEQGVVHRDIKPANILLSRGEPLVADFGIALAVGAAGSSRLTETGLSLGTPYYMSPEQAAGEQYVGPPSDTFALAAVLYEMLTGDPPYVGSTAQAVLVDSAPRPLLVSEFDETAPTVSHDGRWLAYHSDETGRREVYIRPFPDTEGRKIQVSDGGGRSAVWAHSGRELFYATNDPSTTSGARDLMVAEIRPGPLLAVVERRVLFSVPEGLYFANNTTTFLITEDDQRLLMARVAGTGEERSRGDLILIQNFFEELKARLGN